MEPVSNFEEIDFQKYLQVLQRRWVPAAGTFSLIVILAFLYSISLKPIYKAEALLLISKNQTSALTGLGEAIGRLESLKSDSSSANSPLDTQVQIITSIPIIQETVDALHLKNSNRRPLEAALQEKLKVEGIKGTDVINISYPDRDPQVAAKVVNQLTQAYIRHNIEANRAEAVSARKFIQQQLPGNEEAVKQAESALRKFKEQNKIISLEAEAAAAVDETAKLEDEISQAQVQLENVTAQSQKLQKQAALASQEAVSVTSVTEIPGIQQLLTQLQDAQSQLALMESRFHTTHPSVVDQQEKVTALKNLLQQRIKQQGITTLPTGSLQTSQLRQQLISSFARTEVERSGLEKQIITLDNKLVAYKKRASILPKLEQTQRQLERRLKAAQTTYEALLTRLQQVQVTENQNIGNARVISPALVPDKPAASKQIVILAGGAIVGTLLGIIAAFSLDIIDSSIKTVKEAKEMFQYTLLGIIPSVGRNSKKGLSNKNAEQSIPKVIGRDIAQFPIGDAYQMLQANLKFLSSDKQLKAIAVTSSVPKEGKSEVSANLAMAMAQVGRRVLLVDADMRHPIQHHIWKMTNAVGLSNVIVDQIPLELAIREPIPNLYVLPSGVVPPNPVALLDSQRMASLVNSFIKEYDFVIFDTPALAGMADAAVLSNLADGILLVVRPGVVSSTNARAVKEFLNQSNQNVLGMVVNAVNLKNEPDSYFYYTREHAEPSSIFRDSTLVR